MGGLGQDRWGFALTIDVEDAEQAVAVARRVIAEALQQLGVPGPVMPVELLVITWRS